MQTATGLTEAKRGRMTMLTYTGLMKIPDARSASHALDVWAHSAESYCQLGAIVGNDRAYELLGPGQKTIYDKPTEIARKRAIEMAKAIWTHRSLEKLSRECAEEAKANAVSRAAAMGLCPELARQYTANRFRPYMTNEVELIERLTPKRRSIRDLRDQ